MFWFTVPHPETGEPLEVEAEYIRPRRGRRDEFGLPLEPDEPEAIRVLQVMHNFGYPIDYKGIVNYLEAAAWRFLERGA